MGRRFDQYIKISPEEKIELDSIRKKIRDFWERLDNVKNYEELKQLAAEFKSFREKVETTDDKLKKILLWSISDAQMLIEFTEGSLSGLPALTKKGIELSDIKRQIEVNKKMREEQYDGLSYIDYVEKVDTGEKKDSWSKARECTEYYWCKKCDKEYQMWDLDVREILTKGLICPNCRIKMFNVPTAPEQSYYQIYWNIINEKKKEIIKEEIMAFIKKFKIDSDVAEHIFKNLIKCLSDPYSRYYPGEENREIHVLKEAGKNRWKVIISLEKLKRMVYYIDPANAGPR
jgi:hypothetical protein